MNDLSIEKYSLVQIINSRKLVIPDFQRKFRWSLPKQRELIYSVKNNYPIGVITTYDDADMTYILDGVQRLSTIKLFLRKPQDIFTWKFLDNYSFLDDLFSTISKSKVSKINVTRVLKHIYENMSVEQQEIQRYTAFKVKFLNNYEGKEINEIVLEDIFIAFKNIFNISDVLIPVIEYKGSIDNVADIFEKMNTGSVTLSKYEVFAATWNHINCDISTMILNRFVKWYKIYQAILKKNFSDDDFENIQPNNLTLSDVLISLSYKIINSVNFDELNYIIPKIKSVYIYDEEILQRDEFLHEILSGTFISMPTRIDKYVKDNILSKKVEFKDDYVKFLCDFCDIASKELKLVIENFKAHNYKKEEPNPYYYQFLFTFISNLKIKYEITHFNINKRILTNEMKLLLKSCNDLTKMNELEWFRDENRQVSFLNDKLKAVTDATENNGSVNIFKK